MKETLNNTESSNSTKPVLYVVLFSGGRTSAFLAKYMKEHPYYKNCIFIFANTGKEKEETLKFINHCSKI